SPAAPPGKLYQTPFPSLCRMAANALSGLQSPVYQTVTHTVGPRKRSAAGQAVPDSVPVVVPDDG
ncbi:hypothetical protein, partial [Klebsiella pneumoniae]|uniref:hypothetical protein n=1 Tax=Klebsiella pneumoniae TaxID=573 RepID=UPI001D0E9C87